MKPARLFRLIALSLAAAAFVLTSNAQLANAQKSPYTPPSKRDDLTRKQQSSCPPRGSDGKVAPIPEDKNVANHADGSKDYFMGSYHWDDGKGNDVTVEEWCINATVAYFSMVVKLSKNKNETTVVQPGGGGGTVDPGAC